MKKISLYLMIIFYIAAGLNHFIHPEFYIKIMPPWIPHHKMMVLITGICEILFALLLIFPLTRRAGAVCIIFLLVVIFPANIQMMQNYLHENNPFLWLAIIRLPFQILLIWWAYIFTKKD